MVDPIQGKGSPFYGLVAIGNSATEETRAQVFQALSSFQVEE
jgi:hypothetical protein